MLRTCQLLIAVAAFLFMASRLRADAIPVTQRQGTMQGFLTLRSPEGKILAVGTQQNRILGREVHSSLTFHFRDGSIDEETMVFTQDKVFRLLRDHKIQKGPSYPDPVDLAMDVQSGTVRWKIQKQDKTDTRTEHMDLPPDLGNGMISCLIENYPRQLGEVKIPFLVSGSKPRLVTLAIRQNGKDTFAVGGTRREATRFQVHVELGGITGVIAPIVGKQPEDLAVWTIDGPVHSFVRMRGPMYQSGPIWTLELSSPVWSNGQ